MSTFLDGHGYKIVPSKSKTAALLNINGDISDSGLGIDYGTWTPTVDGASSYIDNYGYYVRIGNFCIIGFTIYGKFADGDIASVMAIRGCPVRPTDNFSGGGTLSGYHSESNVTFSGYSITMSGTIIPKGQIMSTSEADHWETYNIYQKSSGDFSASGTIACKVSNGVSSVAKYENLLDHSCDLSMQYIGKTPMYSGMRWSSSSGDPVSYDSTFITGLIPCSPGDTIRIRWDGNSDNIYQQLKTFKYSGSQVAKGYVSFANIIKTGSVIASNVIQSDLAGGKLDFTLATSGGHITGTNYICLTLRGSIDNCIVTVNQAID